MFIAHSLALPFLPSGKLRPIAFAGAKRSSAFPDLPTVAEAGVPGHDSSSCIALFAPKGTPQAAVAKLRAESAKVAATPDIRERLAKSGLEIWPTTAEEMPGVIRDDLARWQKLAREANIKAD